MPFLPILEYPPACLADSLVRRGVTIQSGRIDGGGGEENRIGRVRCLPKDGDRDKEGDGGCSGVAHYFPRNTVRYHATVMAPRA